jgi:valyl-tRNA synthetase
VVDLLPKGYEAKQTEKKWYKVWESRGYFNASTDSKSPVFSMVIPPPNVTGSLHMGHALNNTLQDVITRFKRMKGFNCLWLPGTDHAGIATQNVVEREIAKQGKSRDDLGRERFIEEVWKWKEKYGDLIIKQLKRLGISCDWTRERFTLDPGLSRAVREVFVRLYKEDLIYRGLYLINWCPRCRTALSDIEVEHEDFQGFLYYIKYPVKGEDQSITVATTRPETLLGDVAVAVNPDDDRYKRLVGKVCILPILGREIPVIADSYVDQEFGTGVLKITPAHDLNDFEIGLRHGLPRINVFTRDGKMNEASGPYVGIDRFECRTRILSDLKKQGLFEKEEEYSYALGYCYRCKTVVEPYLSNQWFVRMKELARAAIKAVKDGRIRFIPRMWEETYFQWMENVRDWCISRQIWWGHRIPVWYCETCGEIVVESCPPLACPKCKGRDLVQEEDVLDTWFSSALWPFSTLGWPDDTKDLRLFYPTSVLSTGFDIIYFWVARMIVMGLKFMGDVPFREVYIHALIRDEEGKKMSKSRGNVIDPLDVIEKYGVDALRFTLASLAGQGRDILLSERRIQGARHFCNKIWNMARFIFMNLEGFRKRKLNKEDLLLHDKWILTRLNQVIQEVTSALNEYRFNEAAHTLYGFIWHEYCDWYVEFVKLELDGKRRKVTQVLLVDTLETILKLLHPFMPFITEELWQRLPEKVVESIMISTWPEPREDLIEPSKVEEMMVVKDVIYQIRNIRGEVGISPKALLDVKVRTRTSCAKEILIENMEFIKRLAGVGVLEIGELERPKESAVAIIPDAEIYVPLRGLVDIERERERLKKESLKIEKELFRVEQKVSNHAFLERAPDEVVAKERKKRDELYGRLEKLRTSLKALMQ